VGVHADRRLAQMRARERGLTIVYVDPERYIDPQGRAIPYPVESPQSGDRFIQLTAGEAFPRLVECLGVSLDESEGVKTPLPWPLISGVAVAP